jgi:hypothetical protein
MIPPLRCEQEVHPQELLLIQPAQKDPQANTMASAYIDFFIDLWTKILQLLKRLCYRRTSRTPCSDRDSPGNPDSHDLRSDHEDADEDETPLRVVSPTPISEEDYEEYIHQWGHNGSAVA